MPNQSQQEFLRSAMKALGDMTREDFAKRLGCAQRTLDKWLLPNESKDHRDIDGVVWNLVREILAHEQLKTAHEKLAQKNLKSP